MLKRVAEAAAEQARRARAGMFDPESARLGGYISVRDVARACLAAAECLFGAGDREPLATRSGGTGRRTTVCAPPWTGCRPASQEARNGAVHAQVASVWLTWYDVHTFRG
jgi:hypothetical protein